MNKPFENLTVLDLSRYLLGAYPSLYLADFGARVIKVEDTKVGDYCRQEEPQIDGESYYHYALNRNKESVSFNLKDPEVLDAFYKLVISADVIIETIVRASLNAWGSTTRRSQRSTRGSSTALFLLMARTILAA